MLAFSDQDVNDLGFRLTSALLKSRKRVLITEDLDFIENYFRLSCSTRKNSNGFFSYLINKIKSISILTSGGVICVLATALRHSTRGEFLDYFMTACLFCGVLDAALFSCSSFKKLVVQRSFLSLCDHLDANLRNLKEIFNFIKEYETVEQRIPTFNEKSVHLRNGTFSEAQKVFESLRIATLKVRTFPTPFSDIESDDSYISSIPFEAFDDLLKNTSPPTTLQLKSVIQLIRLQQSEFIRRLLCVLNPVSITDYSRLLNKITSLIGELTDSLKLPFSKIEQHVLLAKSFWFKGEKKQKSSLVNPVTSELVSTIKQSRIYLHSALHHLEEADSLIMYAKESQSDEQLKTSETVEKLSDTLTEVQQCLEFIQTMIRKYETKPANKVCNELKSDVNNKVVEINNSKSNIIKEDYMPIIEDQVFESYVSDGDELDFEAQSNAYNEYSEKTVEMPPVLYEELKSALIPKAKELREREAKALGVPLEKVPIQIVEKEMISRESDSISSQKWETKDYANERQESAIELSKQCCNLANISSIIARTVAKESHKYAVGSEEHFGDDSESDE